MTNHGLDDELEYCNASRYHIGSSFAGRGGSQMDNQSPESMPGNTDEDSPESIPNSNSPLSFPETLGPHVSVSPVIFSGHSVAHDVDESTPRILHREEECKVKDHHPAERETPFDTINLRDPSVVNEGPELRHMFAYITNLKASVDKGIISQGKARYLEKELNLSRCRESATNATINELRGQARELKRALAQSSCDPSEASTDSQIASDYEFLKKHMQNWAFKHFKGSEINPVTPDPILESIDSLGLGNEAFMNALMKLLYIGGRENHLTINTLLLSFLNKHLSSGLSSILTLQGMAAILEFEPYLEAHSPQGGSI
ncbi:hypothetical protein L873DRAFT_1787708 [Choiromyces venosus 120613-1]|uniref:Uncharacterized protein n=1 Tax=Choiromyces venosus 120613-1 TaxID=1336337 RepID=A0A3N4K1P2_9PEZI|nr:hypothetical protein L873DRAFT_1787708 [Choiromyces venosus 120613-1]